MSVDILELLCAVLLVGGGLALLFKRLGLPVIPGYILAGFLLSPQWRYVPVSFPSDSPQVRTLSNLGVLLLLFTVGLEFGFKRIRGLGLKPIAVGTAECCACGVLGYLVARAFSLPEGTALFAGAMLAFSSTTVILKTMDDLGLRGERFAEPLMGLLLVEDLLAIVALVFLASVAGGTAGAGVESAAGAGAAAGHAAVGSVGLGQVAGALVVAIGGWWLIGSILAPRLTAAAQRYGGVELLVILCVGLCIGMGLVFEHLGLSGALGAFITGAILADTRQIRLVRRNVAPLRDVFVAIFFVSFGLRLDPGLLVGNAGQVAAFYVALVAGKVLFTWVFGTLAGVPAKDAAKMGFMLTQIGEFSLVIADLGSRSGIVDPGSAATITGVAILSIFTTSLFSRNDDRVIAAAARRVPPSLRAEFARYAARLDTFSARRVFPGARGRSFERLGAWADALSTGARAILLRATHGSTTATLERLAPWEEYLVEAEVEDNAPAEHVALEALALKERYSAMVVAVEREGRVHVPPEPGYRFSSGDVVLLYGDERHVTSALREFRAPGSQGNGQHGGGHGAQGAHGAHGGDDHGDESLALQDVSLRRVKISEGHPFEGRTLRDLELRRTARALVLAVARGETRIRNLAPDFRIEAGDEVFVVGPKSRIALL